MYLIGIDISKYKHDCFIATEAGEIIKDSFSFDNDCSGFNQFLSILNALDPSQIKRIGLEATGHYGYNLKVFLDHHGYDYMEFNPYLVSKFATSLSLRKTKTDKADAKLLSMILLSVDYKVYPVKSYHIQELKSLTRYYKSLVKKHSKELVVLTNILDLIFPEFKSFFNNRFTKTAYYVLNHYHIPKRISKIPKNSYDKLYHLSKCHFSYAKFIKLKDLAKNTIGHSSQILTAQLLSCLRLIKTIDSEINQVKSLLIHLTKDLDSPLFSIRGIGFISALSIIVEYGNFVSFNSPATMLSYAGLEPSVNQSGTMDKQGHMVKRGSGYLRESLMNVSIPFMIHNPIIYDYYHKKRNEGKPHRVALSHVAKKMIRIIFHLVKYDLHFDSLKLR
jgi:transposase